MVLIFEGDVGITIWIHSHKIEDWFTNGLVTDWVQLCDLHPTYHRSVFMKPSWFKRKSNYITTCYLKSSTGANQDAYKESNFDLSNSPVSAAAAWLVRFDILKPSPSEKLAGTHRTENPGGVCDQNKKPAITSTPTLWKLSGSSLVISQSGRANVGAGGASNAFAAGPIGRHPQSWSAGLIFKGWSYQLSMQNMQTLPGCLLLLPQKYRFPPVIWWKNPCRLMPMNSCPEASD